MIYTKTACNSTFLSGQLDRRAPGHISLYVNDMRINLMSCGEKSLKPLPKTGALAACPAWPASRRRRHLQSNHRQQHVGFERFLQISRDCDIAQLLASADLVVDAHNDDARRRVEFVSNSTATSSPRMCGIERSCNTQPMSLTALAKKPDSFRGRSGRELHATPLPEARFQSGFAPVRGHRPRVRIGRFPSYGPVKNVEFNNLRTS